MAKLDRQRECTEVIRDIVRIAAETLECSQVGVWLYDAGCTLIKTHAVYSLEADEFLAEMELLRKDFPVYFQALEEHKSIAAHEARTDGRTKEFTETYLVPQDIYSLLDATILVSGESRGVVCFEHKRFKRDWLHDEILFSGGVADQVAQVLIDHEKRSVEARLRQAEKLQALGELAGGVAHDFNNQLSGILGNTELLKMKLGDSDLTSYTDKIINMSLNATSIIKQLLAFARKSQYMSEQCSLHALLKDVNDVLTHTIDKKITVETNFYQGVDTFKGDRSLLQNALLNISLNARDAMPDGGVLSFETSLLDADQIAALKHDELIEDQSYIQILISDAGVGMDADTMSRIFEPFYTTKAEDCGTGMGLAVAYGSIKQAGGTITVQSIKGRGTTFQVYLPLSVVDVQVEQHTRQGLPAAEQESSQCILIIDDEEMICAIAEEALELMGYRVAVYSSSVEAVAYYKSHAAQIDLVITDMNMSELNGKEVLSHIKSHNADAKVILSSGKGSYASIEDILALGAADYIPKPYRLSQLSEIVSKNLNA